jgi:hypothetical protein
MDAVSIEESGCETEPLQMLVRGVGRCDLAKSKVVVVSEREQRNLNGSTVYQCIEPILLVVREVDGGSGENTGQNAPVGWTGVKLGSGHTEISECRSSSRVRERNRLYSATLASQRT